MGCDIHGWVEQRVGDRWVAVRELNDNANQRNYKRFAALAGVRGDGPEPRGLPEDISETTSWHVRAWNGDGHSHSWLPVIEALPLFQAVRYPGQEVTEYERRWPESYYFDIESTEDPSTYRIVFWFDN